MLLSRFALAATLAGLLTVVGPRIAPAQERFDWMPAEAESGKLRADDLGGEQLIPRVTLTPTPKPTADLAKFVRVYRIDLQKFGVHNDDSHPVETSAGLNRALQDARQVGADRIVFPHGVYRISESDPLVLDHKNTVVDLNGATLRIQPNGRPRYAVVEIVDGAENLRLTNGVLQGDRDEHDYASEPGTHEWGAGIRFVSGRNLEVDHVTSRDMTGDGVATGHSGSRNRPELLARIMHSIHKKDLEQGAFSDAGEKVASVEKTRTVQPLDLARCEGAFEFGFPGGYSGFPFIKGRVYRACFYDADRKFLERRVCLQFRKVVLPPEARWMHLEFSQPEVSDEPAHAGAPKGGWVGRVTNFRPPTDVHFHHNLMTNNRRLGMAYCGGQKWLIEENRFENSGGTNPGYGVDFEDSAELMQDVVFRNNTFRGNRAGDLVVCAGTELVFEGNQFEKSVVVWGRAHNYEFRGNRYAGGSVIYTTRTGVASIHDNRYENCKLSIVFDTKAVADGLVRKAGRTVATPPLTLERETLVNVSSVVGTYFHLSRCKIDATRFLAGKETRSIRLLDCELADSAVVYEAEGPQVDVKFVGEKSRPREEGPGAGRKRAAP